MEKTPRINPVIWGLVALVLAIVVAILLVIMVNVNTRDDLDGQWVAEESEDVSFDAEISNDEIEIWLEMGDMRGLYWKGTFEIENGVIDGMTIVSEADFPALEKHLFGSMHEDKEFTYQGDSIEFTFGMMGVTTTVGLEEA